MKVSHSAIAAPGGEEEEEVEVEDEDDGAVGRCEKGSDEGSVTVSWYAGWMMVPTMEMSFSTARRARYLTKKAEG